MLSSLEKSVNLKVQILLLVTMNELQNVFLVIEFQSTYHYCASSRAPPARKDATSCASARRSRLCRQTSVPVFSWCRLRRRWWPACTFRWRAEWKSRKIIKFMKPPERETDFEISHIDHGVLISTHFEVPMKRRYHAEGSPWNENRDFDVVLNFQPRNLHDHRDHEDDYDCCDVEVTKDL